MLLSLRFCLQDCIEAFSACANTHSSILQPEKKNLRINNRALNSQTKPGIIYLCIAWDILDGAKPEAKIDAIQIWLAHYF